MHGFCYMHYMHGLQGVHIDDMKRCGIMHSICRQRSNISFYRMWLYIYIRSQKKSNDYYSIAMAAMPPCGQPIRQGKEFLRIRVRNPDRHHLPGSRNSLYQSTMDIYIYIYICIEHAFPLALRHVVHDVSLYKYTLSLFAGRMLILCREAF